MSTSSSVVLLAVAAALASAAAGTPASAPAHWAYQPVRKPIPPAVAGATGPIDAFVLGALATRGLTPSPSADRATLARRAWFNLIGTPPSADEVEAFVNDPDPDAWPRLIDRLLADPRFGERWARYWLDIARYADSKGYVFEEERRYAFSYTYRDWVIRAFNDDLPYDTFILAQLAADLSVGKEDPRHLAAMGFLTLGRRFLNNEADIIDDRLDVTFRGLQAVTLSCARCHDHKFDPIPTADYYSLYGVFASSEEPKEKPLVGEPVRTPGFIAFEAELKKHEQAVTDFHVARKRSLFEEGPLQNYLETCAAGWDKPDNELAALAKERKIYPSVALRWRRHLRKLGDQHPVVAPFLALRNLPAETFACDLDAVLVQLNATASVNPLVLEALTSQPPQSMAEVATIYARLLVKYNLDQPMPDSNAEAMRLVLKSPDGIEGVDPMGLARDYSVPERDEARRLRNAVENFKATSPDGPDRAMVLQERDRPVEPVIFKRGNRNQRGDKVPRQFLGILAGPDRKPFTKGSGRLELASHIASPTNPLTARVHANRVWGWLTGQPLVDTPSDFGVRTPPPANPDLLDHLAASLVDNRWSTKKLIREIMLSTTWQQGSDRPPTPPGTADPTVVDPDNSLSWKMNRRRRDFESFRDSLLAVAGRLDATLGGRPVNLETPEANRRTIYGFIDRQNLPALFRAFDFASPDQHSPRRFQTTVPQQALFALNNPFVLTQAQALAAVPADSPAARLTQLTRRVLGRNPEDEESRAALAFVLAPPVAQSAGDWEYGFGGIDELTGTAAFRPFPFFGKDRWSGSATLPDSELDWTLLTRGGGHPGADSTHAAILQWRAPEPARLSVRGELKRPDANGDGVRLRLVSSRHGVLSTWDIRPGGTATATAGPFVLAAGDALQWVVEPKADNHSDSYQFAPVVVDASNGQVLADASRDFAGPALDPWVAYAQSLLASNEFLFVD